MSLWFLALKAREAGNRPRTFYTGLTVQKCINRLHFPKLLFLKNAQKKVIFETSFVYVLNHRRCRWLTWPT